MKKKFEAILLRLLFVSILISPTIVIFGFDDDLPPVHGPSDSKIVN